MTFVVPPPNQAIGYLVTRDAVGNAQGKVTLFFRLTGFRLSDEETTKDSLCTLPFKVTSDVDGLLQSPFQRGATYQGLRSPLAALQVGAAKGDKWVSFVAPDEGDDSFELPQILGTAGPD